jgi:hypothetical protein
MRDEFLPAQVRLTLPAGSAYASPAGETRLRIDFDWGNDFGSGERTTGETTETLSLVDGEHRTLAVEAQHALPRGWTVSARLPLRWRGGGVLDGIVNWFHRATGLPDAGRPLRPPGGLTVEGRDGDGRRVDWSGSEGAGLGRLELGVRWAPRRRAAGWAAAIAGVAALPTATGAYPDAGVDLGSQALVARTLGSDGDLYLGVGGTRSGVLDVEGLTAPRWRGQAFVAAEWRPSKPVSLLVEAAVATRLVTNLDGFPKAPAYLRLGSKVDLGGRWMLEAGLVEGVNGLHGTTDFGIMLGLVRRWGPSREAPGAP